MLTDGSVDNVRECGLIDGNEQTAGRSRCDRGKNSGGGETSGPVASITELLVDQPGQGGSIVCDTTCDGIVMIKLSGGFGGIGGARTCCGSEIGASKALGSINGRTRFSGTCGGGGGRSKNA